MTLRLKQRSESIEAESRPVPTAKHAVVINTLQRSGLFGCIPHSEITMLADQVGHFFTGPGPLFLEGDTSTKAYVLISGRIDVSLFSTDGRELVLYRVRPGDFFGEMGLLDKGPRTASAYARTECELISISRETLLELLTRNPAAALHLIVSLMQRLCSADQTIKAITFFDMTSRLARLLLEMEEEQGTAGLVRTSQEDLASALGCMRQSVTRTIAVWRRIGYVETGRGYVRILNRRRLKAACRD